MRSTFLGYVLWCSCFFGVFGIHRIYAGKYFTGVLWMLTLGLGGVGQFVDLFLLPGMVERANLHDALDRAEIQRDLALANRRVPAYV